MKNYSETEIHSLIKRFEARELPKVEWTHEAHLVVAIWYNSNFDFEEALELVRKNITEHNSSVGTPNTDNEGYHETITKFWLLTARDFLKNNNSMSIEKSCNAFINSIMAASSFPFKYYSEALLFSVKARHNWVEPDLLDLHQE